ncbi:MAG: hypothetical protein LBC25_00610 [Holosporales bacterium]|jgi:hypothetical protein|nr:hypothetical protein [Holosporales bacterium]
MIDPAKRQNRKLSFSPKLHAIIFTLIINTIIGSAESSQQTNTIKGRDRWIEYEVAYPDDWTSASQICYSDKGLPKKLDEYIVSHAGIIKELNLYGIDIANIQVIMPQLRMLRLQVNYIGDNAFEKAPNLEAIIINPSTNYRITTISPLAFANLEKLQKIYMDPSILESYMSSQAQFVQPFKGCNTFCKIYTDRDAFYADDESSPGCLGTVSEISGLNLQGLRVSIGSERANLPPQNPTQSPGFNQYQATATYPGPARVRVEEVPSPENIYADPVNPTPPHPSLGKVEEVPTVSIPLKRSVPPKAPPVKGTAGKSVAVPARNPAPVPRRARR